MTESTTSRVVVGVDGSDCSEAAVRWAADYANLLGASLELVIGWHWPTSYGVPVGYDGFDPEEDARKVVEAAAADVVAVPADRVKTVVGQGAAGDVLVHASEGAVALVVGTRGHGSLASALVGSTSVHCVHHAQCPVVVVR